jgi:hypothetical protein
MADLLASLEAGFNERTHVGAASRLRNQVLIIDKFMADQREADFPLPQDASSQPIPSHCLPNTRNTRNTKRNVSSLSSASDANIDPSLQSTGSPTTINPSTGVTSGGVYHTVGAPAFDYGTNGAVNNVGGMNGGAPGDELFLFQIPPELLEGWPWPFDATGGGFGGF